MTDKIHAKLDADAARADAVVAKALADPLKAVGKLVRAEVQAANAKVVDGKPIDIEAVMGRVAGHLEGLRAAVDGLGKAAAARATVGSARAAALIKAGTGRDVGADRFAAQGDLAKAAKVSAKRVLDALEEDMAQRAKAAVEHPTPLKAARLDFNQAIVSRGARGLQRSAEMAGAQAVADRAGVPYWIHVGPIDEHNHPTSRIYLGAVMTKEQWEAVDPDAFTTGLHPNERGHLEPIDPEWKSVKDPGALREAIAAGDVYRETDEFSKGELAEAKKPLPGQPKTDEAAMGRALRAGARERERRAGELVDLKARRDELRTQFEVARDKRKAKPVEQHKAAQVTEKMPAPEPAAKAALRAKPERRTAEQVFAADPHLEQARTRVLAARERALAAVAEVDRLKGAGRERDNVKVAAAQEQANTARSALYGAERWWGERVDQADALDVLPVDVVDDVVWWEKKRGAGNFDPDVDAANVRRLFRYQGNKAALVEAAAGRGATALKFYSHQGDKILNGALRARKEDKLSKRDQGRLADLRRLTDTPLPVPMLTYRGILPGKTANTLIAAPVGSPYVQGGFGSWSARFSIGKSFAGPGKLGPHKYQEGAVVLRAVARKGAYIGDNTKFTKYPNEAELLRRDGTPYRIANKTRIDLPGGGHYWLVDLEEEPG